MASAIAKASATLKSQHGSLECNPGLPPTRTGIVSLPTLAAGDYQLQVFATGYTPVRQFVTIVPGPASCSTAVVVPMNTLGSGCAPASQGKGN